MIEGLERLTMVDCNLKNGVQFTIRAFDIIVNINLKF